MAMSRILSQSQSLCLLPRASSSNALISHHRHRSDKPHLIEVDLDAASPSQPESDVVSLGIKKLEEAIHSIIVRRAAPDWLPFLPGHSYWVPPRAAPTRTSNHPAAAMIEALGRLASSDPTTTTNPRLSEDEQMSLISLKGWPSSTYFIQGTSPQHPIPVVELSDTSSSKDEP